jgi:uncharacterized protein
VTVVSNTSPIINLAAIGELELLESLHGRIVVPAAVYREIVDSGSGQPGAAELPSLPWIECRAVKNKALVTALELELDSGEAEAIALASELDAELLLLDERKGRAVARRLGLRVLGLLGVLVQAKRQGLIPAVRPSLEKLLSEAGFFISQALFAEVLAAAGE